MSKRPVLQLSRNEMGEKVWKDISLADFPPEAKLSAKETLLKYDVLIRAKEVSNLRNMPIVLVGPKSGLKCGIADYVELLSASISKLEEKTWIFCDYLQAELLDPKSYAALLIHFEKSLVPKEPYLKKLSKGWDVRTYVVPHEVYCEDPFAFPYSKVDHRIGVVALIKRWIYQLRHRAFFKEEELQKQGFHAKGIFPLSPINAEILKEKGAENIMDLVYLALPVPVQVDPNFDVKLSDFFDPSITKVWGIFGFLSASNDYEAVVEWLKGRPENEGVLLIGGVRDAEEKDSIGSLFNGKIKVTGYVEGSKLGNYFCLMSGFLHIPKTQKNSAALRQILVGD